MGWLIMPADIKQTYQACEICGKPVKPGQKFYFRNKLADVVHAACAWEEEEKRKKGEG